MFDIKVTAHTPVGEFTGYLNGIPVSKDQAASIRDQIQSKVEVLENLTLYLNRDSVVASEMTFPGTLIKRSMFHFHLVEVQ